MGTEHTSRSQGSTDVYANFFSRQFGSITKALASNIRSRENVKTSDDKAHAVSPQVILKSSQQPKTGIEDLHASIDPPLSQKTTLKERICQLFERMFSRFSPKNSNEQPLSARELAMQGMDPNDITDIPTNHAKIQGQSAAQPEKLTPQKELTPQEEMRAKRNLKPTQEERAFFAKHGMTTTYTQPSVTQTKGGLKSPSKAEEVLPKSVSMDHSTNGVEKTTPNGIKSKKALPDTPLYKEILHKLDKRSGEINTLSSKLEKLKNTPIDEDDASAQKNEDEIAQLETSIKASLNRLDQNLMNLKDKSFSDYKKVFLNNSTRMHIMGMRRQVSEALVSPSTTKSIKNQEDSVVTPDKLKIILGEETDREQSISIKKTLTLLKNSVSSENEQAYLDVLVKFHNTIIEDPALWGTWNNPSYEIVKNEIDKLKDEMIAGGVLPIITAGGISQIPLTFSPEEEAHAQTMLKELEKNLYKASDSLSQNAITNNAYTIGKPIEVRLPQGLTEADRFLMKQQLFKANSSLDDYAKTIEKVPAKQEFVTLENMQLARKNFQTTSSAQSQKGPHSSSDAAKMIEKDKLLAGVDAVIVNMETADAHLKKLDEEVSDLSKTVTLFSNKIDSGTTDKAKLLKEWGTLKEAQSKYASLHYRDQMTDAYNPKVSQMRILLMLRTLSNDGFEHADLQRADLYNCKEVLISGKKKIVEDRYPEGTQLAENMESISKEMEKIASKLQSMGLEQPRASDVPPPPLAGS